MARLQNPNKAKRPNSRTYDLSNESIDKLKGLQGYFSKSYNDILETMIDNAFLQMQEATNINKSKELEDTNIKVNFQVQQLTLMFGALKSELERVKVTQDQYKQENVALKELLDDQSEKHNKLSDTVRNQDERLNRHSTRITAQENKKTGLIQSIVG